ncbi:hypothetical protein V6L76_15815 [Pannonibacter sp. Pt2]|uniref:Uncharacterized protein n=1 Tax=Pannonibacter anstelovis TaxID=3121537 RepID=A0ABU7ZR74_9HYPH
MGEEVLRKMAERLGFFEALEAAAERSAPGKTLPWQLHPLCGMVFCSKI